MPVYLLTIHAYCSWSEDNPKGYVQRGEGLKPPDAERAKWRRENARHPPVRFDRQQQLLAHDVVKSITEEKGLRPHACSTTCTHVHQLISFRSPTCTCGASPFCRDACPARGFAEAYLKRFKQKLGQQLAKAANTTGRPYLSRGWDVTPVRDRAHFDHLMTEYLPKHETDEAGVFRRHP